MYSNLPGEAPRIPRLPRQSPRTNEAALWETVTNRSVALPERLERIAQIGANTAEELLMGRIACTQELSQEGEPRPPTYTSPFIFMRGWFATQGNLSQPRPWFTMVADHGHMLYVRPTTECLKTRSSLKVPSPALVDPARVYNATDGPCGLSWFESSLERQHVVADRLVAGLQFLVAKHSLSLPGL
jgi:hypothetical protein